MAIYTHMFNGPFSGTTQVSQYQKGKTNLDFTEARNSEWQWHQLGHTQVCTSLQTDNHASAPPLSRLQAGCPSCRPTNSVNLINQQFLSPVRAVSLLSSRKPSYCHCWTETSPTWTTTGQFSTCHSSLKLMERVVQACLQAHLDGSSLFPGWNLRIVDCTAPKPRLRRCLTTCCWQ